MCRLLTEKLAVLVSMLRTGSSSAIAAATVAAATAACSALLTRGTDQCRACWPAAPACRSTLLWLLRSALAGEATMVSGGSQPASQPSSQPAKQLVAAQPACLPTRASHCPRRPPLLAHHAGSLAACLRTVPATVLRNSETLAVLHARLQQPNPPPTLHVTLCSPSPQKRLLLAPPNP